MTQNFSIAFPGYFAAVASTSFATAPNAAGTVTIDGVAHLASGRKIPNYHVYGYGDLAFLAGDLWDDTEHPRRVGEVSPGHPRAGPVRRR